MGFQNGKSKMTDSNIEKAKVTSKDSEISGTEKIIIGILGAIICFLIVGFPVYVINEKKAQEKLILSKYKIVVEFAEKDYSKKTYIINANGTIDDYSMLPPNLGAFAEWSADGKWIVSTVRYTVDNFWQSDIYVMRADGSQRTRIPAPKNSFSPTWSPNGKWIAYYYDEPYSWGDKGVIITDVACVLGVEACTSPSVSLKLKVGYVNKDSSLSWSPDGRKIAYTGEAKDPDHHPVAHTFVYDIYGTNPPIDLTPSSHNVSSPSWSPDGKKILNYCGDEKRGAPYLFRICIVNSDGSNLTYFDLPSNLMISSTKWSRDGQKIIFLAEVAGEGSAYHQSCWQNCLYPEALFIMNPDGSKLTRIEVDGHEIINWFTWYP
jgi:hypothetical protein